MNTERMPWTCRWSEFRPVSPAPMWMDQWMAQWVCLADRQRGNVESSDRCLECQKYEARQDAREQASRQE
jgi:hypothetical protein